MARVNKKKIVGLTLLVIALAIAIGGWLRVRDQSATATDNAYVRGDITSLAPKVSGYVIAVEVRDNQTVKAGDVLFRIDDQDYRARLAQAQANVQAALARVANTGEQVELQNALVRQAEAQSRAAAADQDLAEKASFRRHALIASGAVSQAAVDEADSVRDRAAAGTAASIATVQATAQRIGVLRTEREAALAAVAQAEAARDLALIDLDSTVVRAPIAGVIGNRQVRVGRLVAPGASLIDIVPVADLWVVANFKETQLATIRPGQTARIRVDGYPDVVFEGVVDSFAPGSGSAFTLLPADNATGNFVRVVQRVPVKIRFRADPALARLMPGLSARVEIDAGSDR